MDHCGPCGDDDAEGRARCAVRGVGVPMSKRYLEMSMAELDEVFRDVACAHLKEFVPGNECPDQYVADLGQTLSPSIGSQPMRHRALSRRSSSFLNPRTS